MLPAAAHLDCFPPPDSGSAIEVEKIPRPIPGGLLDHKVAIEHDRLQAGPKVVRTIDVRPAHLRAANDRISEMGNKLAHENGLGHKGSIEKRYIKSLLR